MSDVRSITIQLMAIAIKRLIDESKEIDVQPLYKAADGLSHAAPETTLGLLQEGVARSMKQCGECTGILDDDGNIVGYHAHYCSKEPRQKAMKKR